MVVRAERRLLVGLGDQDVPAAADEGRAGGQRGRSAVDAGRHDRERGPGDDRRKVGRRAVQVDHDVGSVGRQAVRALVLRFAPCVGKGPGDVTHQRDERRWMGRIDDPEPAPDHVGCRQRRAVTERHPRAHVEDHGGPVVLEIPGRGQGRSGLELGIDRRQALEELSRDGGAVDVALGRRIEGVGRAEQDPDEVGRCMDGRRLRAGEPRGTDRETDDRRDEDRQDESLSPGAATGAGCQVGRVHQAPVGSSPRG